MRFCLKKKELHYCILIKQISFKFIEKIIIHKNQVYIYFFKIVNSKNFFLNLLRKHNLFLFSCFVDFFCVDFFFKKKQRFSLFLTIRNLFNNNKLILVQDLRLVNFSNTFTITNCFFGAAWAERECWDMFGIFFYGNFDLRRILTDYGFKGFPLRKDFPLSGFVEVNYDLTKRVIKYDILELTQDYRTFKFDNVWINN